MRPSRRCNRHRALITILLFCLSGTLAYAGPPTGTIKGAEKKSERRGGKRSSSHRIKHPKPSHGGPLVVRRKANDPERGSLPPFIPATETSINPIDGAEMVKIPAGEFLMGDNDLKDNPRRRITLKSFWIYTKPVTVKQYRKFCDESGRTPPPAPDFNANWQKENDPIVNVTWQDAAAYCAWAKGMLPTEAQWEKAARGTDGRRYPWGQEWLPGKCVSSVGDRATGTAEVAGFEANRYKLYDMAGNVWQWCRDWYQADYASTAPRDNPVGPATGKERVLRGGSWLGEDKGRFRSALRYPLDPKIRLEDGGFRCVYNP